MKEVSTRSAENSNSEGRLTNPVVNPQPRNTPKNDNVPASKDLSSPDQSAYHGGNSNVAEQDQTKLSFLVEDAVLSEVEVSDLQSLCSTIFLASQVEQQVTRPSN